MHFNAASTPTASDAEWQTTCNRHLTYLTQLFGQIHTLICHIHTY